MIKIGMVSLCVPVNDYRETFEVLMLKNLRGLNDYDHLKIELHLDTVHSIKDSAGTTCSGDTGGQPGSGQRCSGKERGLLSRNDAVSPPIRATKPVALRRGKFLSRIAHRSGLKSDPGKWCKAEAL
jgi:hypothetical protein